MNIERLRFCPTDYSVGTRRLSSSNQLRTMISSSRRDAQQRAQWPRSGLAASHAGYSCYSLRGSELRDTKLMQRARETVGSLSGKWQRCFQSDELSTAGLWFGPQDLLGHVHGHKHVRNIHDGADLEISR